MLFSVWSFSCDCQNDVNDLGPCVSDRDLDIMECLSCTLSTMRCLVEYLSDFVL